MGIWYFLILFVGIFLVVKGLLGNKRNGLVLIGVISIAFSIFMFQPGSDEIISELFNFFGIEI
ncbi:hypothetical protein Q9251_04355 [Alkalihalobacillus macyae]|uniref:hypothetical protein n=1 Tax=Guptibacillus hwajinpoensis TaxID=208199 RepID=UPI00273BF7B5|nr:hypothetical protein [Alkalihalobacillus macyae]MDP4550111.1 hypothetical protein [Alkalihalobacillus macyae]